MPLALRRCFATLIDVLVTAAFAAAAAPLLGLRTPSDWTQWALRGTWSLAEHWAWLGLTFLAVWLVYRGVTESWGQSLGKWLLGLEVEGQQGTPGFLRAAARAILPGPFLSRPLGLQVTLVARGELSERLWAGARQLPVLALLAVAGVQLASSSSDERYMRLRTQFAEYGCCACCVPHPVYTGGCAGFAEEARRLLQERHLATWDMLERYCSAQLPELAAGASPP